MTYSTLRFLPSVVRKTRPIHLVLFVTKVCNAHCPFCFYLEDKTLSTETGDLTMDEIKQVSNSLGNLLWLAFSGGEVFLRKDLPDIARLFYANNKPSIMFMPTNGLLPERISGTTEQILKDCPNTAITVKISLDGVGELHDKVRATKNNFVKAMQTYEALAPFIDKYPNFDLGVNTVYSAGNQHEIDKTIDFVRTLKKVTTHTISLARGDIKQPALKDVDMAGYQRAVKRLEQEMVDGDAPVYRFRGGKIKAAQDIIQRRLIHEVATTGKWQIPCHAGKLNVTVTHDAKVYPCEVFSDDFLIADMRKDGFDLEAHLKSDRAKAILQRIGAGCFCTHECYTMTNILFNPKLYPELLKNTLRLRNAK
jgi:MoaA/NifB/PqqE/SkfB family radical SAM enzyme